jgi:hypothetical protein
VTKAQAVAMAKDILDADGWASISREILDADTDNYIVTAARVDGSPIAAAQITTLKNRYSAQAEILGPVRFK